MHHTKDILESLSFIQSRTDMKPTVGIILGSGLGTIRRHIRKCGTYSL